MFAYGLLIGLAAFAVVSLAIWGLIAWRRRVRSLAIVWARLDKGRGSAKKANALFRSLVFSNTIKGTVQLELAVGNVIRKSAHDSGFSHRVLPPEYITVADLDRQVDTTKPTKVLDPAPNLLGAITVPFSNRSDNRCKNSRLKVEFARVMTPRFTKDVDELPAYPDIRSLFAPLGKDLAKELDGKFIDTVNRLLVAPGYTMPETGVAQWRQLGGSVTRSSLAIALRALPISTATVLVNEHFVECMTRWARPTDGVSGKRLTPIAELPSPIIEEEAARGTSWVITDKYDIVPDGAMFLFAEPEKLGRSFVLQDIVAWLDRRAFMLEFFAHTSVGAAISARSVARVDFLAMQRKDIAGSGSRLHSQR